MKSYSYCSPQPFAAGTGKSNHEELEGHEAWNRIKYQMDEVIHTSLILRDLRGVNSSERDYRMFTLPASLIGQALETKETNAEFLFLHL